MGSGALRGGRGEAATARPTAEYSTEMP